MKCPVCNDRDLLMSDRQGVEIDYCPQCRGVWLDRGELDKIIERTGGVQPVQTGERASEGSRYSSPPPKHEREYGHKDDRYHGHGKEHSKKSLLKELFDF